MPFATYVLEVMWDGTNWTDETARLIACEWTRGRDFASQLTGKASAGVFRATLLNPDGRFASFNTSGPLYGNLLPARKVRFRTTAPSAATLWQGFLGEIRPDPGGREMEPTATLVAYGPLGWVNERDARVAVETSIGTGAAIGKLLDDAGWPAGDRVLDTGEITMSRWAAGRGNALRHMREIEETEFGFLSETKDGKIVFEDIKHRGRTPHTTSQATFSDASGAALPYESIEQIDPWREIYNRFEADVTTYAVQALATLWTLSGETPDIGPGATREFWARYPTSDAPTQAHHVDAWTTPVATTDYVANSAADGSGTDLTGSLTVTVSKFDTSMMISIANGHATLRAYLTLLQARGTPVYRNDQIGIVAEDSASQTKYGKRTWPLGGKFYPTTAKALDYVNWGVARYKDPLAILLLTYYANQSSDHLTQALSRDVSDRVTVVASGTGASGAQLGISRDFWIEEERHRYSLDGHWVTYALSDASLESGAWVLGVSLLGQSTRLWP